MEFAGFSPRSIHYLPRQPRDPPPPSPSSNSIPPLGLSDSFCCHRLPDSWRMNLTWYVRARPALYITPAWKTVPDRLGVSLPPPPTNSLCQLPGSLGPAIWNDSGLLELAYAPKHLAQRRNIVGATVRRDTKFISQRDFPGDSETFRARYPLRERRFVSAVEGAGIRCELTGATRRNWIDEHPIGRCLLRSFRFSWDFQWFLMIACTCLR